MLRLVDPRPHGLSLDRLGLGSPMEAPRMDANAMTVREVVIYLSVA